jgi:hypothetical protein
MSGIAAKISRKKRKEIAMENPHMQRALNRKMTDYSQPRKEAFAYIMAQLYYLKTDPERARWILSYAEGLYKYGQDSLRRIKDMEIRKLNEELTAKNTPKVEIVER